MVKKFQPQSRSPLKNNRPVLVFVQIHSRRNSTHATHSRFSPRRSSGSLPFFRPRVHISRASSRLCRESLVNPHRPSQPPSANKSPRLFRALAWSLSLHEKFVCFGKLLNQCDTEGQGLRIPRWYFYRFHCSYIYGAFKALRNRRNCEYYIMCNCIK